MAKPVVCFSRLINFFGFGLLLAWGLALGMRCRAANRCGSQHRSSSSCLPAARGRRGTVAGSLTCASLKKGTSGQLSLSLSGLSHLLRKIRAWAQLPSCLHQVMKSRKGWCSSIRGWTQVIPCLADVPFKTRFHLLLGFQVHHSCYECCYKSSREWGEPWPVPLRSPGNRSPADLRHSNASLPQGWGVHYQGINHPSPAGPPCSTVLPDCMSYVTYSAITFLFTFLYHLPHLAVFEHLPKVSYIIIL